MALATTSLPAWSQIGLSEIDKLSSTEVSLVIEDLFRVAEEVNQKVSIYHGDLKNLRADVIITTEFQVHITIKQPLQGRKVRRKLQRREQKKLRSIQSQLLSRAGNAPENYPVILANFYNIVLESMLKYSDKTIVIPVGLGFSGLRSKDDVHILLRVSRHFLDDHFEKVDRIIFSVAKKTDFKVLCGLMHRYFPLLELEGSDFSVEEYLKEHPEDRSFYEELQRERRPVTIEIF